MLSTIFLTTWLPVISLLIMDVAAVPATNPLCGGNACYPVLVNDPKIKLIAKDFCSWYLHYPQTTTTTVKTTVTATAKGSTVPGSTVKITATSSATITAKATSTATLQNTVTQTVTETTTANPKVKRAPLPGYLPPIGAPSDYRPTPIAQFAPATVSAACSCLVAPTTVTSTVKSTTTTTVTPKVTGAAVTTTVATTTVTGTVTTTTQATTTLPDATTTRSITTTVTPAPTVACGEPGSEVGNQKGFRKPEATEYPPEGYRGPQPNGINTQADCYQYCKDFNEFQILSYSFGADCICHTGNLCKVLTFDEAGDFVGGDVSLPL